ncbi:hypothetical protein EDC42_0008 [Methanobrevibacter gottschalkii DSM 11977]|uniref:Uncharacterized protein n=1 Tax=Methanobrevibacter gottschalkii DSM 11977 TaxID=1122229 RepID=A0A3N5B5W5_9EURY|nr:hypothetical protein [Methanobrevibacter gottschalkii]RPF52479.1 hypothetical protein EDC42_0008 [Methanobrevibacter gottschalkii DSM 11977]
MDKKWIVLTIFLVIFGFLILNGLNNSIHVGDSYFSLPEGYVEGNIVKYNDVNITNGTTSLRIIEYNDNNIQEHIDKYVNYSTNHNYSTKINNFNVDGMNVYKSEIIQNNKTFHYWFIKKDKVYEIVTWDGNSYTDNTVFNLIKSN